MKREPDKYLPKVEVFEFPGWKITVRRPDITPEERARRMKAIHDAAASLLMCEERRRMQSVLTTSENFSCE